MMWLLIPGSDRAAARRVVSRIDQILGYPRTHAAGEVDRVGSASQVVPLASISTETQMEILVHSTTAGLLALRGVIAINVNSVADALRRRYFDIGDGVRKLLRDIITERGWEVRATLPGVEANWTRVATRDGEAGSSDGVPIPEGSE
jgi:hypothetical protein